MFTRYLKTIKKWLEKMTFWSHLTSFGIHYKWSYYDTVSRISSMADILCFCVSKVYVNSWQKLWWIFKQMEPVFVWVCMHLERPVGGWWGMFGLVWCQIDKHIILNFLSNTHRSTEERKEQHSNRTWNCMKWIMNITLKIQEVVHWLNYM